MEDTRDLAKQLGQLAGELGTALGELERIECGAWKGKTAIAFTDYIGKDVTPLIRKSHDSFDKASRALHRWADDLQDFQDRADRLEKSAGDKLDAKAKAEGKADGKGSDELAKASSAVDGVIQKVHELEADYRAAARQVSKELDKAGDIAPDEPGFWDKLGKGIENTWDATGDWIKDHADLIKLVGDLLGDLSGILTVLAIITAPFEPLGAIFAVAAVVSSGLALATHLVAKAAGADVGWMSIGLDALGAIPGIGAFSKGVKVADEATAVARAGKLGRGFEGLGTTGRNIIGVGDKVAGAKSFKVFGKTVGLWGTKTGGVIKAEGIMNRMSLVAENNIRNGQWLGTRGIPGLKKIDSMSVLGRGIDSAIKIAPKAFTMPSHIGDLGDRFHESAKAH
ncbi:enoyl-CoA hydratase/isomerase family protein [Streptomyces shenzhenensis]|uniref:enoyl-CoA hydratase/isomerase family protein n=1 Tax=Streptomyces shenzhenensis TaxID=943815 RepID=UPI002867EEB3|nr:enoyl-CoA hydratase/isomerase family protein [Streptomyces shenzhenensis]